MICSTRKTTFIRTCGEKTLINVHNCPTTKKKCRTQVRHVLRPCSGQTGS